MTVFGQTLDGQQVFALISMVAVLALWMVSLNRERGHRRWLNNRLGRRKTEDPTAPGGPSSRPPAGPWG